MQILDGKERIVYVTSMNKAIHELSGNVLIDSWCRVTTYDAELHVYAEGGDLSYMNVHADPRVKTIPLDDNPWMKEWLEKNKHNIPRRYGGTGTREMSMWNAKASLWFRKAASLVTCYRDLDPMSIMVWIDADSIVIKELERERVRDILADSDIVYICGRVRKQTRGIETGLVFLRKCHAVDSVVANLVRKYNSSATNWSSLERWDDGFVFKIVLQEMNNKETRFEDQVHVLDSGAKCRDLCSILTADPLTETFLGNYFVHMKGLHFATGADGNCGNGTNKARTRKYMNLLQEHGERRRRAPE